MDEDPEQLQRRLGGLLVVAEEQQKAVQAAITGLRAETERLAGARTAIDALPAKLLSAVEAGAAAAVQSAAQGAQQSLDQLAATAGQTDTALTGSVAAFRKSWGLTLVGLTAVICLVLAGFTWAMGARGRYELDQFTARKQALQADISTLQAAKTDLERRGRRLLWHTCGSDPCLEVSPRDRGDWQGPKGVHLAIPATTRDEQR